MRISHRKVAGDTDVCGIDDDDDTTDVEEPSEVGRSGDEPDDGVGASLGADITNPLR